MTSVGDQFERRVLLVAPTRRDGEVTSSLLVGAGLTCDVCGNLHELSSQLPAGAGSVLLTEEALIAPGIEPLIHMLQNQPAWSDLPIVLMLQRGIPGPAVSDVLKLLSNVTLLERPAATHAVVSALQAALRARQRQYQIRDQLEAIRQAEVKARDLQEQLQLAVNASELGTFHCEMPLGRILWNDRCKAHFWLPPDAEVDFDRFYALLHPDDRERTRLAVEQCVFQGVPYDIEYRTVSPQGQVRWVRATGRTYYNSRNEPLRFDGTTQDITPQKEFAQQREQLLESERAARTEAERAGRMKDEFLATLSHELRTPLSAILGYATLLRMAKLDDAEMAEAFETIERNARLQAQLIDDLLDMNRIMSGKIRLEAQPVALPEVIAAAVGTVRPSAEAKQIRLQVQISPLPAPIRGDPARLQQIVWNLLSNAIKFTPQRGQVQVAMRPAGAYVEITVVDTGPGIQPEFLPHVFDRFRQADASTTRNFGGLGLGLSIVKHLVELHGGMVQARNGRTEGAQFVVSLPLAAKHEGQAAIVPRRLPSSPQLASFDYDVNLTGVRVLAVDDEPDACALVKRVLEEYHAEVETANSAHRALELINEKAFHVLVSDIGMPGEDGYQLIRRIRELDKSRGEIPAVALTAFARSEDRQRAAMAGFQTHLAKPIEAGELVAVVANLAGRAS